VKDLLQLWAFLTGPRLTLGTYGPLPFLQLPLEIPRELTKTHWHIMGTTGSGKSYFLANLFLSLIEKGFPVTLVDPHGDLATLVLAHLVAKGIYQDGSSYERIVYLDLPESERRERYLPLNPLKQELPAHTIASNFREAMHRAFPELSQGAAIFDTLLPRALRVLLANKLPLTALEPFFFDDAFRARLLVRLGEPAITSYFQNAYSKLRRGEQITYAGSVLRRAALLTDLPILRYSLSHPENLLQFRQILDTGKSLIINLAVREAEASRLLGCLLTVGYEQASLSRAAVLPGQRGPTHHLIVDEFHSFATNSGLAFSNMLSQTRKFGLFLALSHQYWGQANQHLKEALQNTGIEVVFNLGRTDAEQSARELSRVDPLLVKHEVSDEHAVERTHPVFYSLMEQWQRFTECLQELPQGHFMLKLRGQKVKAGRSRKLPEPRVDPKELSEVEQEYLHRYFKPKGEIAAALRSRTPTAERAGVPYQPINRRERLRPHLSRRPVPVD
jgi:hypothetical protein